MDKNKIITSNINDTALIFEGGGMRASYKGTVPDTKSFEASALNYFWKYSSMILHYRKNNQLVFKAIEIHEPSVVAVFDDFFTSLIRIKYVLPKEQTLVELDRLIKLAEAL
ncbi:MAG: hypothetical protein PHO29_12240 [Acetobacterium sp.]|nr:hypothetical protein [Acetobacterium sp.]